MELVAVATMLMNDNYFMGILYHLIIYSSKCAYSYEKGCEMATRNTQLQTYNTVVQESERAGCQANNIWYFRS